MSMICSYSWAFDDIPAMTGKDFVGDDTITNEKGILTSAAADDDVASDDGDSDDDDSGLLFLAFRMIQDCDHFSFSTPFHFLIT